MTDRLERSDIRMAGLIRDALAEDGISQAAFCRMVGVSTKHLNLVLSGKETARTAALEYWAFVLGRRFTITLARLSDAADAGT